MNRKSIKIWEWYISHNELYNKEIEPELKIEIIKHKTAVLLNHKNPLAAVVQNYVSSRFRSYIFG